MERPCRNWIKNELIYSRGKLKIFSHSGPNGQYEKEKMASSLQDNFFRDKSNNVKNKKKGKKTETT